MRETKYSTRFKRDYRREKSGRHARTLDAALNFDHPLSGDWIDHRNCHIKPDLVLIYRKPNDETLELVRLGSHSELGL